MDVLEILKKTNAVLKGHFLLSSGLHSNTYIQCAQALKYPEYAEAFGKRLAELFPEKPDYVISPALGGIIIGYEVARSFNVPFIFTERNENGKMELRRNFQIEEGKKVIIVEDVITTGKSTKEVINAIKKYSPKIISIGCIVNRSKENHIENLSIKSLIKINVETYEPTDCPLCKKGLDIVKPGSRK
ncbi:orotate phosphoribosyltransferase [Thermosipho ferrireducens]|uniref:Orotate phosphoribosyltransferase n=1 Tax=Thermosipho ferrireducens TaxID=2571116 RepID=A0ABX7SA83_9BACT|nr:orotate phosphoribosyltransferase [Thermosipho ferrireducens]QTA38313.1 orotate phosphoribosyltransferase [Thermosipho ferrireducens]